MADSSELLSQSWDVFLAYTRPDGEVARRLYSALTALGLRVFFDQETLPPGADWHRLVPQSVGKSMVVVVLVPAASEVGHYQRSEVIIAVEAVKRERTRLVPVRLGPNAVMPYGTEQFQAVDMFDDLDVERVAGQVAALMPTPGARVGMVFCDRIPVVSRFFTGRGELLERLRRSLGGGRATVVLQATGLGGVGKTTVAAALADGSRDDFDVVWWIRAEDPALLVADLVELAPHLGVPILGDHGASAALVRRRLETTSLTWFLVFDNVPNQRAVEDWVPRRGPGSVLITSRASSFSLADKVIPVDTFPRYVAAAFLRRRVASANPAAAAERLDPVVERLAGLPLALEQAGAWVAQVPNRRFARFVDLFDSAASDPFADGTRPSGYEHTVSTTWSVSVRAATVVAPDAGRVLELLSFLAPEPVPCSWLREMGDDDYFATDGSGAVDEALDALHMYSLATIAADDTISVHRLVQTVTSRSATPEAAGAAIRTLYRQSSEDPFSHYHRWQILTQLVPHVLAVCENARTMAAVYAHELSSMLNEVARFQNLSGALSAGLATATTAQSIAYSHLGADHPDTLSSQNWIAGLMHRSGDVNGAIALYGKTLSAMRRILGADHPMTINLRNNLAHAHAGAGSPELGIAMHKANVAACRRVHGDDHPHTLTSRNNLAAAYLLAGEPHRAIPSLKTLLADRQRLVGAEDPDALITQSNLAKAYMADGDMATALALFEATLAARRKIHGDDHPLTLENGLNLAEAHLAQGETATAVELFEATLAAQRRILGDDNPDTRATQAALLRARGGSAR